LAFSALKRGHFIAHISDLVRLKGAIMNDGVVLDLDAVMINPFPDYDCFTSSLPTKKTGGMQIKFGKTQPRFIVDDWDGEALSIFPIKVHSSIKSDILELIEKIESSLNASPKTGTKGWNYIMYTIRDIANKHKHMKIMKPIHCGAVPAWMSKGNCYSLESPTRLDGSTELYGYRLPSIDEILSDAYCIQHFFDSTAKVDITEREHFWSNIKSGCLIDAEAMLIYGSEWREQLVYINTL
jgi:hypothetical protein